MVESQVLLKLLLVLLVGQGQCGDWEFRFSDNVTDCDGFENTVFKAEMDYGHNTDNGYDALWLSGDVEFFKDIGLGYFFELEVKKYLDIGYDPIFSTTLEVCKGLEDKEALWADAIEDMGLTECPIKAGRYHSNRFQLDPEFAEENLTHEFYGRYLIFFRFYDPEKNILSCHEVGVSIDETKGKD